MDISDGLSLDLFRMTIASNVGAALDLGTIPIHRDVKKTHDDVTPLQHALSDGEDFELILTASAQTAEKILCDETLRSLGAKVSRIGTIVSQPGLWTHDWKKLSPSGWLH